MIKNKGFNKAFGEIWNPKYYYPITIILFLYYLPKRESVSNVSSSILYYSSIIVYYTTTLLATLTHLSTFRRGFIKVVYSTTKRDMLFKTYIKGYMREQVSC